MSDDALLRSMRDRSDEELLAITTGTASGYTEQARSMAATALRERRIELPADLEELREQAAVAESEATLRSYRLDEAQGRAEGRAWGIRLMIIGIGAFALPLIGLQFRVLNLLGAVLPVAAVVLGIVGFVLFARASQLDSNSESDDKL